MENNWMDAEALKDIDPYKLAFLQTLLFESRNLKKEQMLPFLMAAAKRGKEKNISFTNEEIAKIAAVLKKDASAEETAKIERLMALRNK